MSLLEKNKMSEMFEEKINGFLSGGEVSVLPWLHLKDCLTESQDLQQVASLKKFGAVLKKQDLNSIATTEKNLCSDILTQLLVTVDPKRALHRAIASILQSFPDGDQALLSAKLGSALIGQLLSCPKTDASEQRRCVDTVTGLLENFPLGEKSLSSVFDQVVSFLYKALQFFMESVSCVKDTIGQNEAMYNCLAAVKTIIAVVQKCYPRGSPISDTRTVQGTMEAVLHTMWAILSDASYLADCRSAAGMALVLLLRSLVHGDGHQLSQVIYSALFYHLSATDSQSPLPLSSHQHFQFDTASLPAQSYLFICHGVLAMLDSKDLIRGLLPTDGQCLLLHVLFPEILGLVESLTEPSSALIASRTLTMWTAVAVVAMTPGCHSNSEASLVGSAEIPQKLIQYVWTNWNHPIDGIRYQTKSIFENVLQLHVLAKQSKVYNPSDDEFLLGLLSSLASVSWHVRGKYTPLGCLVTHLGAERILELYPTMPLELLKVFGDQTLAPYACDLLERLFTDHKSHLTKDCHGTDGITHWQNTWIVPLLEFLCCPTTSKDQKTYLTEYYIPRLLKCSPESLAFIIQHLHETNDGSPASPSKPGQLGALVTCLKTSRSMGLIKHDGKSSNDVDQSGSSLLWKGLVPYGRLKEALCHKDSQVRIGALGLLCDCNRTTEAVSARELSLLQFFLVLNVNSPSPSFRQQMGAHLKKLFLRLRESGRVCLKQTTKQHLKKDPADSSPANLIKTYKEFMSWLIQLLFEALEPGSSYPRRTVALHTLKTMTQIYDCQTTESKYSFCDLSEVWTPDHIQLLLYRLADPYESNKVLAFDLLSSLSQETLGLMDQKYLHQLYGNALHLASSNKPHNCETAAFLLRLLACQLARPLKEAASDLPQSIMGVLEDLCASLAEEVGMAKGSLLEAAVQGPMYGNLHCIRELLTSLDLRSVLNSEGWGSMIARLIKLCLEVADAAAVVVCNSSPEGYIPEETDHVLEDPDQKSEQGDAGSKQANTDSRALKVTPQMVLVCCWRSMKEVSLLMGQLAQSAPLAAGGNSLGLISQAQLEEIGTFFLRLLKESKHRGAFELAYAGFFMLTTRLWKSEAALLHQLPKQWLQGLLSDVTASQSMLCATRRSAGIPFAIQALVSSEPSTNGKRCFKHAMSTLLSLAFPSSSSSDAITSQVHALNILRVLYKDTRLGEDVIPYIADGVRAAVLGFAAQLWAVRNSSTLLFSALVTRIFGVQRAKQDQDRRNCMTGKEFFARFPSLHPFLLHQLREATSLNTRSGMAHLHPSLFPVLLLLSRLYPSPMDGAHTRLSMDHFVPHVLRCAGSAVYKTRALAARALVPLVPANRQVDMLKDLLGSLARTPDAPAQHNYIHGVLLQIHELLESALPTSSSEPEKCKPLLDVMSSLGDYIWLASKDNRCLVTRAAFLAILEKLLFKTSSLPSSCKAQEDSQGNLRAKVVSIATSEIHGPCLKAEGLVHEPGFVTLQTIRASISLRWAFLCEPMEGSLSSSEITDGGLREKSVDIPSEKRTGQFPSPVDKKPESKQIFTPKTTSREQEDCNGDKHQFLPGQSLDATWVALLSSPIYEVRLLTLDDLVESSQSWSSNLISSHPHSLAMSSSLLFQKLVAMVTEEEHETCLMKVYELLSHHPMTCQFPWQLPKCQITCVECFQAAIDVASQPKQREDLISSVVHFTCSLVPVIYSEIHSAEYDSVESAHRLLSDWSFLLDQCSKADRTVHSHLTAVKAIGTLAAIVLMDPSACLGNIPFTMWGVVMRLLQDDDLEVQQGAVSCIRGVAVKMEHPNVLYHMDTQPSLGLHFGVALFIMMFVEKSPMNCLQRLVEWGIGMLEEGSSDQEEELQDDRLFDQGEANTNYEGLLLTKVISKHLRSLGKMVYGGMHSSPEDRSVLNWDISQTGKESGAGKLMEKKRSQQGELGRCETLSPDKTPAPACDTESVGSSEAVLLSHTSQDGRDILGGLSSSVLEQDPNPRVTSTGPTVPSILLEGEDCIEAVSVSRLELSASVIQQLQKSAGDSFSHLVSKLEEHLQTWPLTSPFLNTTDWEARCVDCCRILLCCQGLAELLPHIAAVQHLKERLVPLLERVRERFCRDRQGSYSSLVKEPLLILRQWCGLEGVSSN